MAPPSPTSQPDTDVEMTDVTQTVEAPSQVPSVPAAKKAAGRKRARFDVDADAETPNPKRTQAQKGKPSESVANGETPARAARKSRARAGAASTPRSSRARKTAPRIFESVAADGETPAASPSPSPAPIAGQKRGRADDDADVDVPETPKPKRQRAAAKVDTTAPAPTTSAPAPEARTPASPPARPKSRKAPILSSAWAKGFLARKEPINTQASVAPPPTSARNSARAAENVSTPAEATAAPPAEAATVPPPTPAHNIRAATKEPVDTQDSETVTKDEDSAAPAPTPAHNDPVDAQDSQPAPPAETSAVPPATPARNTRAARKASTPAASTTKDEAPVPSTPARSTRAARKASTPAEASAIPPDTPARNTRAATRAASRGTTPVEPTTAAAPPPAPTPARNTRAATRAASKASTAEPEEAVDKKATAPTPRKRGLGKRAAPKNKKTATTEEPASIAGPSEESKELAVESADSDKRAQKDAVIAMAPVTVAFSPEPEEAVDAKPTAAPTSKKRASGKRATPKKKKTTATEEPVVASPSFTEAVDSAVQSADAQPTTTPTPKKRASGKRASSKRAQKKDTTEEPTTAGPSTELEEAVDSAIQSADAQLVPATTQASAPATAGPFKKTVTTVAPSVIRTPNPAAPKLTPEIVKRNAEARKAEREANRAREAEEKAAKEAAAASAEQPDPEPSTCTPAPRKRGAAAKTSRLSTIPEVDTPKSAAAEKEDVDDAPSATPAPAQKKKKKNAADGGDSEGFLAAIADFQAEKEDVDVSTDDLYAPSAPSTRKSNSSRAAPTSRSATAYLPKKKAKGKASEDAEEASSPKKNKPATTTTTAAAKRARSASAAGSDSEDGAGPSSSSSRPNKQAKKNDDDQLAQVTNTAAATGPSSSSSLSSSTITPVGADESSFGLAALLQQGPSVPIGKGKARATMARKQPVKRKRTARAASKEAVVHHPSEQGASSATAIDVDADMVEARDFASPETAARRPRTGGKTVARPTTGGKSVWPTAGGRMTTLSGRTVPGLGAAASKMVPQQSSRLGPVDDEDEESDDESSEVGSDGDDDVHNRDTITIDDDEGDASSDEDDSDAGSEASEASNEPANDAAEKNDSAYPQCSSSYPSTCLHRNTIFNPIQAKIPSAAVIELHHTRASAAAKQPDTAVGYVPVRLRLLLRSSIRAQRLYHDHGLAALADARFDMPAWATREAVVGYDIYLNTRGRHVWVHDEDGDEDEAKTSWWTAQRLLDVYAAAVYMQDVDCCDTIASAIVRTVRRQGCDRKGGPRHVEFEMEVDTFLGQLDDVAALLDHIEDDEARAANDDWIAVALATARPIRNLLLDLYSGPGHAEETLKVLKEKDVEELDDGFFGELVDLCERRVAGTTKNTPVFMAQEMRWCEHYHLHPHFFSLDEADLLFPKREGEEYVDRNCPALIAMHKATGCGEEEQMPEQRDEKEVLAEDRELYRKWQKWNAESIDKKEKEQFDTFEQYRARLKNRAAYLKFVEQESKVWTDKDRSNYLKDLLF